MSFRFFLPRAAITLILAYASYWAILLAWADYLSRTDTEANIRRAAQLIPFNATYQARAGNLRRAIELNPFYSAAWLELAIQAEERQDFVEAERCLLEAAKVDQLFEPRWSLANFYLRRGNEAEFWKWIRLASLRSYGDRTALFRLCWRMTDRPEPILAALPDYGTLLSDYLQFLAGEQNWEAALGALPRVLGSPDASQAVLMGVCDKLLEAGRGRDALLVWNGMVTRKWLPYPSLDPASGLLLTNAALQAPPLGKGFDWRLLWRAGVHSAWVGPQHRLRIELSGKQLERTGLISQFLPITEPGHYVFRYRYRSEGFQPASGVHWSVRDTSGNALAGSADLAAGDWVTSTFEFTVPHSETLLTLLLTYHRRPGSTRTEGVLWLDSGMDLQRRTSPVATAR